MCNTLSPLAVDVAVSQVSLAAMKAKSGIQPTGEALASASRLLGVLKRELRVHQVSPPIPAEVVPDEQLRELLQNALNERDPQRSLFPQVGLSNLEQIIRLLDALLETKILPVKDAEDLQISLFHLNPRPSLSNTTPRKLGPPCPTRNILHLKLIIKLAF